MQGKSIADLLILLKLFLYYQWKFQQSTTPLRSKINGIHSG
jgi:hypothetical protein